MSLRASSLRVMEASGHVWHDLPWVRITELHAGGIQKSISAETAFGSDLAVANDLLDRLWPLCEKVGRQRKDKDLVAGSIVLKLKTSQFRLLTRSRSLSRPTYYGSDLFSVAKPLVESEADGCRFRLIGVGTKDLMERADVAHPDLFGEEPHHAVESAMDEMRERFGDDAIAKGRGSDR